MSRFIENMKIREKISELLVKHNMSTRQAFISELISLIEQEKLEAVEEIASNFYHPEFCFKSGKQFRKCARCTLDELKSTYKTGGKGE